MEKEQKIIIARLAISAVLFGFSFFSFLGWIGKLVVSLVSFLIIAYDVIWESIKGIFHGEIFDEKFLMLIASIGAFALQEYHEAVAVMLFYQLGEFLQDLAVDKSKDSIKKLMDIRPDYANQICDDEIKKVNPSGLNINDKIIVYAGEKIPIDGVVLDGCSSLDTSALTGESLPRDIEKDDKVLAGSVNLSSTITVLVTSKFEESSVSKIIELVENAEEKKAKSENFITKFAKIYTPVVVLLAVVLAILPPLAFSESWGTWIHRALSFLVISCPCALVISIPLTFFVGIGGASKKGILIKGANHIETLSKLNTVGFDKTGTLTKGNFKVSKIVALSGDEDKILKLCALAEHGQSHPIAESILAFANEKFKLNFNEVSNQTVLSGLGIKAEIKGKTIYAGNQKLMESINVEIPEIYEVGTIVFVASDKLLGYIVILDEIKETSLVALKKLKACGINQICMLTGDKNEVAESIASELAIDTCYAELLPEDKAKIIEDLKINPSNKVAFVGDGINDAPVLKTADLGISMGGLGSDIAIESADVVLMDDNPEKLADAITLSKKTMRIVKQNIIFTISFKLIMLVLGALGLTSMWMAIFADVGVSLLAILNSLRALKTKNR